MAFVAVTPDHIDVFSLRSTPRSRCMPGSRLCVCFCSYSTVVIRISSLIFYFFYFLLFILVYLFYYILLYFNIYLLNEEEEREKTDEKTLVARVGFEPPTFRSCGQRSVHYATEAPPIPDVLRVKVVTKKGGSLTTGLIK